MALFFRSTCQINGVEKIMTKLKKFGWNFCMKSWVSMTFVVTYPLDRRGRCLYLSSVCTLHYWWRTALWQVYRTHLDLHLINPDQCRRIITQMKHIRNFSPEQRKHTSYKATPFLLVFVTHWSEKLKEKSIGGILLLHWKKNPLCY